MRRVGLRGKGQMEGWIRRSLRRMGLRGKPRKS
jgi:hypothetical protein